MNETLKEKQKVNSLKETNGIKRRWKMFNKNKSLLLLTLPMVLFIFVFNYIPMLGIVIAFKNFKFNKGILGSDWNGFDNFRFYFISPDAWRTTRNTVGYNSVFIITVLVISVLVALLLYEVTRKPLIKIYQTIMFFPHFLSWVVIAYMAYGFLNPRLGILNQIFSTFGIETIDWYNTPKPWVYILPIANLWKHVGMNCLLYYASLIGIDKQYFEAAKIEGASKFQITTKITLPFLYPLMIILTILAVGRIFSTDFGLFYQLPMNSPMLYPTTDVIDTYVYRALIEMGNVGMSAAVGVFKSFVGFVMVMITNTIVRKVNSENALF